MLFTKVTELWSLYWEVEAGSRGHPSVHKEFEAISLTPTALVTPLCNTLTCILLWTCTQVLKFVLSLCSVITLQMISAEQALTEAKGWGQPLPCTASLGSQIASVLICSWLLLGNETKLIKIQPTNRCQNYSALPEPTRLSQGLTLHQNCL